MIDESTCTSRARKIRESEARNARIKNDLKYQNNNL